MPTVRPGGILMRIEASVLMTYMKAYVEGRLSVYNVPKTEFTPGGNGVGIVTAVGKNVWHVKPGQRVVISSQLEAGCEIVASLFHSPRMVFLDEPTIGLDVSGKAVIRELLRTESERERVTLLLTSHENGDMERVCERVIVIHRGQLLWDGPIAALRRSYLKAKRITLWSEAEHLEFALPGVRVLSSGSYRTELEVTLEIAPLGQVVDAALRQAALRDIAVEDAPLDDVIRALYANAERGSGTA